MGSMQEIMQLCRLCLMKDQVNTPIFENVDDISQVFIRISACLPIKVSREDALPKNICENCSYKLEIFYELLNTSVASEKQLLAWAKQLGVDRLPKVISTCSLSTTHVRPLVMKQEVSELLDPHSIDDLDASDDLDLTNQTQDYNISQQQLSYETVGFEFQPDQFIDNQTTTDIASKSTPKRKRSAIGLNIDLDSEDDAGLCSSKSAKTDGIHNGESDADDTAFDDLPSTSGENDQPGPSGIGKPSDSSVKFLTYGQLAIITKVEVKDDDNQEKENEVDDESIYSLSFEDDDDDDDNYDQFEYEKESLKTILAQNQRSKPKPSNRNYMLCSICGKYVSTLEKHIQIYHGKFKCVKCLATFRTEQELDAHIELHEDNEYPCSECTLSFKRPLEYAYHSKEHCGLKTYSCPLCNYKTLSRGSVKIHIQHHEKDYKYTCEICNRGFISNSVYTEHLDGHTGIKKFQCDICLKKFLYKRYLMVHRKLNHKKILEGYEDVNECHVCKRKFSFEKSLVRHLSKIHGIGKDVSVRCTICEKKMANPYNLKMHMRTHTGEKPYICETCGAAFTKRVNLRRHKHNLHNQ